MSINFLIGIFRTFERNMFDIESFWIELGKLLRREEQLYLIKLKIMMVAAIITLSFSVVTVAAESNQIQETVEIVTTTEEMRTTFTDIPFMDVWDSSFPLLFYPPLELLKKEQATYMVEEGDTLYRIALNNGMTVQDLATLNNLSGDIIYPGDVLTISGEDPGNEVASLDSVQVASVAEEETTSKSVPKEPAFNQSVSSPPESTGSEMTVTATAYTAYCTGCSGTTAYGIDLRSNPEQKVIAVDPSIIPLGTKVWVEGYGEAIAGDVGSAIKGHKIDVFIPTYESAMEWGVKKVKIKIIN